MDRDPLEERDILKFLDALDDQRVVEKIASVLHGQIKYRAKPNPDGSGYTMDFIKTKEENLNAPSPR